MLDVLDTVLARCEKFGLNLHPKKCQFFAKVLEDAFYRQHEARARKIPRVGRHAAADMSWRVAAVLVRGEMDATQHYRIWMHNV